MAATIDLLPTIARLAGGKVPDDRIIDGKNIWPLMQGTPGAKSPHEAYFVVRGGRATVRSGRWKFYPWPEGADRRRRGQSDRPRPKEPPVQFIRRFADIAETKNVAQEHPDVVSRLQRLVDAHQEDIRKNRPAARASGDGRLNSLSLCRRGANVPRKSATGSRPPTTVYLRSELLSSRAG